MKFTTAIRTGIVRPGKAWKGILATWFVTLVFSSLLILPARSAMNSAYGDSLITGRLHGAIDAEVLAELGPSLGNIISSLGMSFLLLLFAGFLINVFLSAGLFAGVSHFRTGFWTAAGAYFWSFLVIMLIVGVIMLFLLFFALFAAAMISGIDNIMSEMKLIRAFLVAGAVFLFILPVFILWADYARAWQVRSDSNRPFTALGFGMKQTFRTFFSSWIMMALLLIIQAAYWWLAMKVLPGLYSGWEGSVNFFLLAAQIAIIIKIFLRVLRYSCVTAAMEMNHPV